jgi:peptidoglycan/LPS O-acetylase OafA/YrhL
MLRYGPRDASAEQILSSFTMTTDYAGHPLRAGIGQAWTLEVEVTFYALVACAAAAGAPRLGRYLGRRGRLGLVIGLAVLVAVYSLRRGLLGTPLPPNGHGLTVALGLFAPGVILAALQLRRRPARLTPRGRHRLAGGLVGLGVGALMIRSALGATPQAIPLVFVGAAAILTGVYLRERVDGLPWRLLDTRVLRWVGRRAYPTYLINPPLIGSVLLLTKQSGDPVTTLAATVVVALPLTLAAAHLLHRGVEVPCLRLRARGSPAVPAARGAAVAGPSA